MCFSVCVCVCTTSSWWIKGLYNGVGCVFVCITWPLTWQRVLLTFSTPFTRCRSDTPNNCAVTVSFRYASIHTSVDWCRPAANTVTYLGLKFHSPVWNIYLRLIWGGETLTVSALSVGRSVRPSVCVSSGQLSIHQWLPTETVDGIPPHAHLDYLQLP